ncbi:MAG TPA: helix-turn-helix domain-containing protein [Sphingomicrobium sp.]|jgi:DNA-binding CsgD family transcriptional regulator|nr:helix-turn-helix domain-containing protein [Sphingomicrobium sp.]
MLSVRFQADLTPREAQILEFVANGMSAKEVASQINISPRTVERHIEHVRLKLRARNRPHMVTQAIAQGILLLDGAPDAAQLTLLRRDDLAETAEQSELAAFANTA